VTGELPSGWAFAPLRDLGRWIGGGTPSKANPTFWTRGTIPWVSPKDIKSDVIDRTVDYITEDAFESSATSLVPEGSVLIVTRSGILANALPVATTARPVAINQDLKALIPGEGISARYVAYALRRFADETLRNCSKDGTTVPSILTDRLQRFEIPIAPSAEQLRIVGIIEAILERTKKLREQLFALPGQLERCRSVILGTAFRGDATRAWRARNSAAAEPTAVLSSLEKAHATGGSQIKEPPHDLVSSFSTRPDVPWRFVPLLSACDPERGITYGIIQTGEPTQGGVPTVRAGDIKNSRIDLLGLKKVRADLSAQHTRTLLHGGEVLVSIRGTTGSVAVAGPEMDGMNVSREIAVIPVLPSVSARYAAYALASPAGQAIITGHVKGIAQSGINLADLRTFPLPVASEDEQREIITFIDNAYSRIDALAASIQAAEGSVNDLVAAVLRRAFRGALVPQDPNDDPASTLLERMRAERAVEAATPQPKYKKPTVSKVVSGRKTDMSQTRKDVGRDHLSEIVARTSSRSMNVKELYIQADMDVDEFYKQLATELSHGQLRQSADKTNLELANEA
jgi:type I restriction enzyme S subunit